MPGVSEDGFLRTLSVDIRKLADLSNRVAERIAAAKEVRMTTPSGTDITMTLGHPVTVGDGLCREPGELDFFPPRPNTPRLPGRERPGPGGGRWLHHPDWKAG